MEGIAAITVSDVVALGPVLIAAGIAVVFIWIIWRTESWHMVRRRLWSLVHGKEELSDEATRNYVNQQTSLAAFNVFAGVPVRTLRDAHQLMEWCKARDVDLGELRMCGDYFDPETRHVNDRWLPPVWFGKAMRVFALCIVLIGVIVMQAITVPAFLSLRETGTDFLATGTELRPVWPLPPFAAPSLRVADCKRPVEGEVRRTGFSAHDIGIMCTFLGKPDFVKYVRDTLFGQRVVVVILTIATLFFAYRVGLWAMRILYAHKLLRRRPDPASPDAQMELDFS